MTEPSHAMGICDIAGCNEVATHAFRDDDLYVELCLGHSKDKEKQFDDEYERTPQNSPFRGSPDSTIRHGCGGTIHIHSLEGNKEYRVCTECSYALLIKDIDGDRFEVKHAGKG